MPRALLHFEHTNKDVDPLAGPACELIVCRPGWLSDFEYWYVDEHYALIDDEGNRYALRWNSKAGMVADVIETSANIRALFYKRLGTWIEALPRRLKRDLDLPDLRSEQQLSNLLDKAEVLKRLSDCK